MKRKDFGFTLIEIIIAVAIFIIIVVGIINVLVRSQSFVQNEVKNASFPTGPIGTVQGPSVTETQVQTSIPTGSQL